MLSIQQLIKALRQQTTTQTLKDLLALLSGTTANKRNTLLMTSSSTMPTTSNEHEELSLATMPHTIQHQQQQQQFSNTLEAKQRGCEDIEVAATHDTSTQDTTNKNSIQSEINIRNNSTTAAGYTKNLQQNSFKQPQQHFQHFHTQQNQQKTNQNQINFAMSSLAAAAADYNGDAMQGGSSSNSNDRQSQQPDSATNDAAATPPAASGKPCFNTGLPEIVKFMELIGNLKHTKRTGWVLRDVNDCESISGHMYRMSLLTFLLDGSEGLNQIRCMELALVHDLAESLVGDITPFCGISKDVKRAMEFKAMEDICKLIEPRGKRIMELFEEYEQGESAESRFVKDLDRLDLIMQAFEYEKRDNCLLKHQEFFDSTEGKFNHPFVKKVVNEIYAQRDEMAKAKGAIAPPTIVVPAMELSDSAKAIINGHHKKVMAAACELNPMPATNGHAENAATTS